MSQDTALNNVVQLFMLFSDNYKSKWKFDVEGMEKMLILKCPFLAIPSETFPSFYFYLCWVRFEKMTFGIDLLKRGRVFQHRNKI